MVFYYHIRGGQCLNQHSHITLATSDIVCYVGRDKHENEYLIKYGWPGDIWFHVDGLSSAHVYFRLKNVSIVDSIPIDDLPTESVYDMMQICKHNSISGCKLASVKMVYTPHSNLKKTFDMDSGTVTYHDNKRCRYGRCEKDRIRVKELEKTKSDDLDVDYYAEMKTNERRIIERKKRERKAQYEKGNDASSGEDLYDPMLDDLRAIKQKAAASGGDAQSGLDAGLEALEGLSLAPLDQHGGNKAESNTAKEAMPVWMREAEARQREPSADVLFLRERGYTAAEAKAACQSNWSRIEALSNLYLTLGDESEEPSGVMSVEESLEARMEEKAVLVAMFGFVDEDDEASAKFVDVESESSLDVALPITSYESPARYGDAPLLQMEVFVDKVAPNYPAQVPVIALVGGGLSERLLREVTTRVRTEAHEQLGEAQIFNLLSFVGDACTEVVQKETEQLAKERANRLREEKEAAEAKRNEARAKQGPVPNSFRTETERRNYAKEVAARASSGDTSRVSMIKKGKPREYVNTGVSDASLFDDMFK